MSTPDPVIADVIPLRAVASCVIYIRISKDRDDETSTASQLAEARAYAAFKGWRVVAVYTDEGKSAFRQKAYRPGFEAAMAHIENKTADVLLTWKLNRYMRDADEFMVNWKRIQKAGGEFASVTESFDTTNAWGKIGLYIMASIAEIESEIKSDQIKSWHNGRRMQEIPPPPTGPKPYGYSRIRNGLVIDDEAAPEAANVRAMAAIVLATGNASAAKAHADASGVLRASGRPLSLTGVKQVLTNPTIAGLRKVGDDYVRGAWEPIIDRDTWERLCAVLTDPNRRTSFSDGKPKHLLVGIIQCADCKRPMHSRTHDAGSRYSCKACKQSIVMTTADEAVSDAVLTMLDKPAWDALRMQGRTVDPTVTARTARELEALTAMHDAGEIEFDEWQTMRRSVNRRLEAASTRAAVVLPDVDDVAKAWPAMTVAHKRMIVTAAFERITCEAHSDAMQGRSRITVD